MNKPKPSQKENPAAGNAPAAGTPIAGGTPEMGGIPDNTEPQTPPETNPNKHPELIIVEKAIERPVLILGITEDVVVVVCGTTEALPLLTKAWEQKAAPAIIIPRDISSMPFAELITRLLADEDIPDTFILVPENCFPTHKVCIADLTAYRIRKKLIDPASNKWGRDGFTHLPVLLEATTILKTLELLNDDAEFTSAEFFEKYNTLAHAGELPEEIGMSFGNTVAYADNPTPCMARLAEALIRKKFICTTAEGFTPIKERLALLYDGK